MQELRDLSSRIDDFWDRAWLNHQEIRFLIDMRNAPEARQRLEDLKRMLASLVNANSPYDSYELDPHVSLPMLARHAEIRVTTEEGKETEALQLIEDFTSRFPTQLSLPEYKALAEEVATPYGICGGDSNSDCAGINFSLPNFPGDGGSNNPPPPTPHPVFGCESNGMPCGMNFPSGGGGLDGCTYGSGDWGGMIYGIAPNTGGWQNSGGNIRGWWTNIPFLVGLAKTFRWQPQGRLNARPVKTSPRPRPVETNKPAPGQDPEGEIDREMEELFQKAAEWAGAFTGKCGSFPWGDVSAPAILFPGQRCTISPATCHDDEIY